METQRLNYLLDRYYKGKCTADEEAELDAWYQSLNISGQQFGNHIQSAGGERQVAEDMYAGFKARANIGAKVYRLGYQKWMMRVAAVLTGFCLLTGGYYLLNRPADRIAVVVPAKTNENRFIMLPDGSRVVLRAGSRLNYPSSFSGNKREVELIGEAYFDIHHNPKKPFIIHTGNIKTTVLGTAFNIAAYPSQKKVIVTVTRGRVKVEDNSKISVILTPNEQVIWDNKTKAAQKIKVEAARSLVWAGSDVSFDGVRFKTIASLLSRRYQVAIEFKNPAVEECPITASFTGTETLKDILEILCTTRGASYKFESEQKVTIDGNGCN
jgi:transmembrane sensor